MVSDLTAVIFIISLAAIVFYFGSSLKNRRQGLLNTLFMELGLLYSLWVVALLGMKFTKPDNTTQLMVLDCITTAGAHMAALYLTIAIAFVKSYDKLPKYCYLLFIVPCLTTLLCVTNPLHHLYYVEFSVIKSELVMGPYVPISGIYSYICLVASSFIMINFAIKNRSRLYLKQSILFALGGFSPLIVSAIATFTNSLPISATALSFIPIIVFDGIAIYQLHLVDIKPIAMQHVLDWISDLYMVLSDNGLVINYNVPFEKVFASQYGITENRYLKDCVKEEDISKKTAIYNMLTAVDACMEADTVISYEQAVTLEKEGTPVKYYYVTDVSPLKNGDQLAGFVVIFKDVTQLKRSMQQLQDGQKHMMEQERFAFLGQMMAGLAHNLKTPIMSISGCVATVDSLVDEYESSLSDPQVVEEDYREICNEIKDWLQKIRESTSYMSEIITAIKGQANSVTPFGDSTFTLNELMKRTTLLMRHELYTSGCTLVADYDPSLNVTLHGDINNLIQVMNNLVSNAIYAQKQVGGGKIVIGMKADKEELHVSVADTGPGVSPNVRARLFKEMITSKGTMGSGLGLYISNAVVRGKFGGTMWLQDNPGGGAVFGFSIPLGAAPVVKREES